MIDKTNNSNTNELVNEPVFGELTMNEDLKHSILIVSLIVNLVVLTTWIALQVTTQYDAEIASMLFTR
ncbi:MAG: hypothetical protein ABWX90_01435 [Candidatus Saccharimonadales bacterium]